MADNAFLDGYEASTPDAATNPQYPGNQEYQGPGSSAERYKAHWKNKQQVYPYGFNDEGGK